MQTYLNKLKANGVPTLKFKCPHCGEALETEANTTEHDWDTLSECWHCDRTFWKVTRANSLPVIAKQLNESGKPTAN